jgi:replication initiator protein RepSA
MHTNAELTANGRSSMTSSVLSLAHVLVDDGIGTAGDSRGLNTELLQRATRDDYDRWLATAVAAGGCVRPVRLRGTVRDVDTVTGEVLDGLDTEDLPDKAIYVPCGDRRASVCPPCAETYRADIYQLIRAGLAGGKGMPESLAAHPCVFATFTAPSFGPVHTRVVASSGSIARCRPRRKASFCRHGRRLSCGQRHKATDACLGRPLCPDCYDYSAVVVWNAHAPELWRRTTIALRRRLDKLAKAHGTRVKLSYAKVAEFQRRGLIHFHAVFRLDGYDPARPDQAMPPHPAFTAEVVAEVIQRVAGTTWFATVSHPAKPRGWDISWGVQIDPQVVRLTRDGEVTDSKVASYLAKYAVKSTEPVGVLPGRITASNASVYADPGTYEGRLIAACIRLGAHPHEDFRALRRWAHMLGYRGHFATKSRRYSTTMRVLRAARRDWVRRQQPIAKRGGDRTVITLTDLRWAGRGWRTTGDALLALSAAARAREQRRIAREELAVTS